MQKIKKLSALLLAVVLMLVVMTGCGGGGYAPMDGRATFVNRVNQARRESHSSMLIRDTDFDKLAKSGMELYTMYLNGSITWSQLKATRNEILNMSNSYGRYTFLDWYTAKTNDEYYSGAYKFASNDSIRTVSGDYIGVYEASYQGKMWICVVIVDVY